MTPWRFLLTAMLAWLCWLPKTATNCSTVYAAYLACGILIAQLFRSSIHLSASRIFWNVLMAGWGGAGVLLTTRPNLIVMDGTHTGFYLLLMLPLAIIVVIMTTRNVSVNQLVMRCFLLIVTTSLLICCQGALSVGRLLVNSWLFLMTIIACYCLLPVKLGSCNKHLQAGRVFISYTLRDPRGAYLAQTLKSMFDQIGLPYYDYVPAQEAPNAQGDRTQEIQSELQNAVASSCCTCEIISSVTICREWIQLERALIRQHELHRFFLVLDPEFLDRHACEASGPITRIDCAWMFLGTKGSVGIEWDPLTEELLTNPNFKLVDGTRMHMIEEMISEAGSGFQPSRGFRMFCRDFACRLNSARRSKSRTDAFMSVHSHLQDKGLARPGSR